MQVQIIGIVVSLTSALNVILSPIFVPPLQARFGIRRFFSMAVGTIFVEALLIPCFQKIATLGRAVIYTALAIQLPLKNFHLMAWPLFCRASGLLATGSAIVLIAGAGGRAVGPAIAGWIFSIATQFPSGSLGGQLSWMTLFLISIPPLIVTFYLPRDLTKTSQDEADEEIAVVNEGVHEYQAVEDRES